MASPYELDDSRGPAPWNPPPRPRPHDPPPGTPPPEAPPSGGLASPQMGGDATPGDQIFSKLSPKPGTPSSLASPNHTHPTPSSLLHPRRTHPGVVARVEFLRHGGDVLHQELVPLPLKVDLVHVDVNGWHVFVATLDAVVLDVTKENVVSRILRSNHHPPPHTHTP